MLSRVFVPLFFCLLNAACFGQAVTVLIVNAANDRPVGNQRVYVSGLSRSLAMNDMEARVNLIRNPHSADLSLVTSDKGEVDFDLPKPAPAYFYVWARLSGPHWDCTCLVRVTTDEVAKKGFLTRSAYAERKHDATIQPRPGEVLFVLRPTPWWVRVFWPLLKG
jgi:hypothetical protein